MEDVIDKATTSPISTRKHGDVLIVLSNNPPVNALSTPVRQGLVDAIEQAEADDSVKAVVIACEGQTFFAGADITEFGKPPQQPWLPMVVDRIENCSKPVVAAIHGTALGGGLEVALGCHYRVADKSAKLGTPEVKLGLLPGAGGTQRLPRVAGVRKALEMTATGNPIDARQAFDCGLVDRIVEGDLIPHAVGYAEEVRDVRPIPKSSGRQDRIGDADPGVFDQFRKENAKRFRGFEAPLKNIDAVRIACEKPYSEGVIEERKLFMELMGGEQSAAQRYFFFAERKANKIEGLPDGTEPRPIAQGRRDRCRNDGRRNFDELPQRGNSGDHRRDGSRGARPRHRPHAEELRGERRQGKADRRAGRKSDGLPSADTRFRRARRLRSHHRGSL